VTNVADTVAVAETREIVQNWLADLQSALDARNPEAIAGLFGAEAFLRDLLVFDWDLRNLFGADAVSVELTSSDRTVRELRIRTGSEPQVQPKGEQPHVTGFIEFVTDVGRCDGFVQLRRDVDGRWRALTLAVELEELTGFPAMVGENRPIGRTYGPMKGRRSWEDEHDVEFRETDPRVVIVGAGHNGLMIAARLIRLNVPVLVLERNARVGDNWRKRYPSLALHDPLPADHLPYIPLPSSWPYFTPKNKFGDYLESFATLMDIPVWTGTTVENVHFDNATRSWVIDVIRDSGERRRVQPGHFVVATGPFALPKRPDIPGGEHFQGTIVHSTEFGGGAAWKGKRAIVVGTGVSGHDVAQELYENGAEVTLLQRAPSHVVHAPTFHRHMFQDYIADGVSTEDADLMLASRPLGALPNGQVVFEMMATEDPELHEGLTAAGFQVADGTGSSVTIYYNVGASELIIDGRVKIRRGKIERFTPTGVVLDDDFELPADIVVLATGFGNIRDSSRHLLGDLIDELPEIGGMDEGRGLIGLWRPSGHDRLWFAIAMGIFLGRFNSKFLALQIKAIEEGIIPG
jgi:putative flavoprotein involved in K+ transport